MKKVFILINFILLTSLAEAQYRARGLDWRKQRHEVFASIGTANFLGDLGGRNNVGRDYSPIDLNITATRSAFGVGYRYRVLEWLNVSGKFNYLIVKGDDALTKEKYRNNRNLNFKSNIFELSGRLEFGYQTKNKPGNRYSLKRVTGHFRNVNSQAIYFFMGIGGFYYNPKGKDQSGKYIELRPLHTEGQGLPGGPKQYSNYSICIPMGVFYKYTLNKQFSIGAELSWRKTFTDYIDDVGTTYYDAAALTANYGALSAAMADPSKNDIPGATLPNASGGAAQRGDKQKDSYFSFEVTVGYLIKPKTKAARLRSKF